MIRTLALAGVLVLIPVGAEACMCGPRDNVMAQLKERYGEEVRSTGIFREGLAIIEILRGPKGSFTVLSSSPRGMTCVVTFGTHMEDQNIISGPYENAEP
jgi:hypothetical protein|tara:strand:+ start:63 stop:362 length:300 start_codon:yes stop_codon:yes gene_type:complete